MQDEQNDELSKCANDNLKVPLWLVSHSRIIIITWIDSTETLKTLHFERACCYFYGEQVENDAQWGKR